MKNIAWSKEGFIAYSIDGPNNLAITHMETINGHNWRLAPPQKFTVEPPDSEMIAKVGTAAKPNIENTKRQKLTFSNSINNYCKRLLTIDHVDWSSHGNYLACIDSHGNMSIFGSGLSKGSSGQYQLSPFNEFMILHSDTVADSDSKITHLEEFPKVTSTTSDLSSIDKFSTRIVGFEWLPGNKSNFGMLPAAKVKLNQPTINPFSDDPKDMLTHQYRYKFQPQTPLGFHHPNATKQACFGLRSNGELCLWYQGSQALNFLRYTQPLDELDGSTRTDPITFASFGFQRSGGVLVATYSDASRLVEVFLLNVDWGSLRSVDEKSNETDNNNKEPRFIIKRVLKEYINPLESNGEPRRLSHLKVISSTFAIDVEQSIYLIFNSNSKKSTIYRYNIQSLDLESDNVFLTKSDSSKNLENIPLTKYLHLKEKLEFDVPVINFDTASRSLLIYFALENGEVEVRYSDNLLKPFGNTSYKDYVVSLFDVGFKIQKVTKKFSSLLMSPYLSAVVYLPKNKNQNQNLVLSLAEIDSSINRKEISSLDRLNISAAFAVSHSESYFAKACCDDLIAAIQLEISKYLAIDESKAINFTNSLNIECHTSLKFSLLYNNDQLDRLLSNPPLQKLLSLQMSLGTMKNWSRSKQGKMAWSILNIRECSFGIVMTLKAWFKDSQRLSAILSKDPKAFVLTSANLEWKSELIARSLGVIKWITNFVIFIYQELLGLCLLMSSRYQKKFQTALSNSIALPFIMAKASRVLLMSSIKAFKSLSNFTSKFIDDYNIKPNTPVNQACQKLKDIIKEPLVDIDLFVKFLGSVEQAVKQSLTNFKNDQKGDSNPQIIEQKLVIQGKIPRELLESAKIILKAFNDNISKDLDRSRIYFCDLSWLGVSEIGSFETSSSNYKEPYYVFSQNEKIDYLRKCLISQNVESNKKISRIKRCVRCGSVANVEVGSKIIKGFSPSINGSSGNSGISTNNWDRAFDHLCFCGAFWVTERERGNIIVK